MLIGQFVLETGCGCQVPPSRKFFSAQNVSVQFAMEEGWIPQELTSGLLFFTKSILALKLSNYNNGKQERQE